jgi:hypothetical protein
MNAAFNLNNQKQFMAIEIGNVFTDAVLAFEF